MERSSMQGMLELMRQPAFAVRDGVIVYINHAAAGILVVPGTAVSQFLSPDEQEYILPEDGCLYLTLCVEEHCYDASVSALDGYHIFVLDQEDAASHLQALALAARELRVPLSNMMIAADRLLPHLAEDSAAQQAEYMNRSLHQMLRLIGNMSDAARYATEAIPRQELRDITSLMQEIFDKAGALLEHTGVRLKFTNLPESVYSLTDAEKLERAIYNMLSNAVKHAGSTVEASLTRKGQKLCLTVCDHGDGIPDNILGNIFSMHLRQPGLEDGRHGIGLGMVMIRSAARAHSGTVLVERLKEGGTRLTLTLAIRNQLDGNLRSPILRVDYAGDSDHALTELADVLPAKLYKIE